MWYAKRIAVGRPRRCAFTLIEMLAVVGIAVILLGLSLPAIQASRASARLAQCASNLRDIGIALHGFQQSHGRFPRAFCGMLPGRRPYCFSGHAKLLPWLGREDVAGMIDWNDIAGEGDWPNLRLGPNTTAARMHVATFVCPADAFATTGKNSYRESRGVPPALWGRDGYGPFASRPAGFVDGLATTTIYSERLVGNGKVTDYQRNARPLEFRSQGFDPPSECVLAAQNGPDRVSADSYLGAAWLRGRERHVIYYHYLPPNTPIQDCHVTGVDHAILTPRSLHSGGVNVLFVAGQVQFVSDAIALPVWMAWATAAGNETVSE